MLGDRRSQIFLGIPRDEHIRRMIRRLFSYRGRIAQTFNERGVSVLGRVISSSLDEVNQRVILITDIDSGDDVPFVFDIYVSDVRNYYTLGVEPTESNDKRISSVKVMLPDLY